MVLRSGSHRARSDCVRSGTESQGHHLSPHRRQTPESRVVRDLPGTSMSLAASIAAHPPFISVAPRPQTYPSSRVPEYGGCVHPSSKSRYDIHMSAEQERFFWPPGNQVTPTAPGIRDRGYDAPGIKEIPDVLDNPRCISRRILAFYRHECCTDSAYVHSGSGLLFCDKCRKKRGEGCILIQAF